MAQLHQQEVHIVLIKSFLPLLNFRNTLTPNEALLKTVPVINV
jgi:hypothetical protein